MRGARGLTLIELMGTLAVIGATSLVAGALVLHAERTRDLGAAYANDVAETRRALDAIERDVRAARDVRANRTSLVVVTDAAEIAWKLDGTSLRRGGEVVARNVAAFGTDHAHGVVCVQVELGRRSPGATRTASVSASVRLRAPQERAK